MDTRSGDELPAELRAFLYACIDAVEQVEILLLLRRERRGWTAREVAQHVGLVEAPTRIHLETLRARGLLVAEAAEETAFQYGPRTAEFARYADLLAEQHAQARGAVVRFVATRARRTKSFADAFKLRDPGTE